MDLWDALGVSPQQGLLVAGLGLLAALVLAGRALSGKARGGNEGGLDLHDR